MGGQAKTRRTNTLTTTRARLDFQNTATDDRVCPNQQQRTASACSFSISAIKSTDKSSPYHGLPRDINLIHTILHPPRSHFLPALTTPGNILLAPYFRNRRPRRQCREPLALCSPQPLLSWPAHHDVTGPFDGLLEEV